MNKRPHITIACLTAALTIVGCSKQEEAAPPPPIRSTMPPTPAQSTADKALAAAQSTAQAGAAKFSALYQAFESADPQTRAIVQQCVDALKAGKYPDAQKLLSELFARPGLTAEQKQAVQQASVDAMQKAGANSASAPNELKKQLPLSK